MGTFGECKICSEGEGRSGGFPMEYKPQYWQLLAMCLGRGPLCPNPGLRFLYARLCENEEQLMQSGLALRNKNAKLKE